MPGNILADQVVYHTHARRSETCRMTEMHDTPKEKVDISSRQLRDLKDLLAKNSVRRGEFTLASGKTSDVYVDARLTTMSPRGLVLIGRLGLEQLARTDWRPDSIGGLTMGADPISFAISYTGALEGADIRAFSVRKEPKTHGTGNRIEGPFQKNDRVVIIEDVITTGKSALQAIEAVSAAGGNVVGVLALVDRQDGGTANIRQHGYEVVSITRIDELKHHLG